MTTRVAVVGMGKMGISHLSIVRAVPGVEVVAIVDESSYMLGILKKYTGLQPYTSMTKMLAEARPDAVIIATPTRLHFPMVKEVLEAGASAFCEKPLTLSAAQSEELADIAKRRGLVTQVGYHNRFVGAFQEAKKLIDQGAIGRITHGLAEAYGPVILKPQGATWRSKSMEGGGCLYDYAAHPLNLINWYLGEPVGVGGTVLNRVFSSEIDDEVSSTLYYPEGQTVSVSVNWSDESVRKMTTRITLWGTRGQLYVDRQELQLYLREGDLPPEGYRTGWNIHYTTDLTEPVDFYLRGEEYSAQLEHFIARVAGKTDEDVNSFASAAATDRCIERMITDAANGPTVLLSDAAAAPPPPPARRKMSFVRRLLARIPGVK